jgi:hypothetical protein
VGWLSVKEGGGKAIQAFNLYSAEFMPSALLLQIDFPLLHKE